MPKAKTEPKSKTLCPGGRSFGCRHFEHEPGQIILCYRCEARMGCGLCTEITRDILCLNCNNWATRTALKAHGDIVPNWKVKRVRTDKGWIHHEPTSPDPIEFIGKLL